MGLLIIGSTVADVIVNLPRLPRQGEDLHIHSQALALGGCAYNVFHTARLLGAEADLFSPVGSGLYGEYVARELAARGVRPLIPPVAEPNGCCYCLVDETGERTFLCHHGAEYRFRREWFDALDPAAVTGVYLCGLEVEEPTGENLLDSLEALAPGVLWFAPGPRIQRIPPRRMARLFALGANLHLNRREALAFACAPDAPAAARLIHSLTGRDVVITLGPEGALCLAGDELRLIPGCPAQVVDTIGAGDSHLGALMAAQSRGLDLFAAAALANRVAARVVSQAGACLAALPEGFELG